MLDCVLNECHFGYSSRGWVSVDTVAGNKCNYRDFKCFLFRLGKGSKVEKELQVQPH